MENRSKMKRMNFWLSIIGISLWIIVGMVYLIKH